MFSFIIENTIAISIIKGNILILEFAHGQACGGILQGLGLEPPHWH